MDRKDLNRLEHMLDAAKAISEYIKKKAEWICKKIGSFWAGSFANFS